MSTLGIILAICVVVTIIGLIALFFTDNGSKAEDLLCKITIPFMVVAVLIILYAKARVAFEKEQAATSTIEESLQ